jgi:HEAT repeat protein
MSGSAPQDTEEMAVGRLIEKLNSLLEGEQASAALVACGQPAVEPLRRFLMEGRPSGIYQPRRWAVEALAGLQAKDVLLDYLRSNRPIADPVARMGEDAVQSAAAAALKQWPGDEVCEVLTSIIQHRHLAGAVEALGELGYVEATPSIIAALEDDVCRKTAETALQKLGHAAVPELMIAALNQRPNREEESPLSLRRRSSAAQLLFDIGVSADQWIPLRRLIDETEPGILTAAARMAWQVGARVDAGAIAARLIAALDHADWYFRDEIGDVLVEIFEVAEQMVDHEIARRINQPLEKRVADNALRTLLRVARRIREGQ